MEEKDIKKLTLPFAIICLGILALFIIKPIAVPIVIGLLLAYIFYPIYEKLHKKINSKNLSAMSLAILILLVVLVPILLLMPLFIRQVFEFYLSLKGADFSVIITTLFPSIASNPSIYAEVISSISHFSSNISAFVLNIFQGTILKIPQLLFGVVILLFTFYFSLKESENVKGYFSTFFPFKADVEKKFYEKFGQVTNSIVYGQVVVGITQGIISGIGYYMFGLPNPLLLTVITTVVGVIPVIGPWLVWIPVDIFLFINGDTTKATQLLIYGLLVINWIDTILRPQVVARKAEMNPAIALIGAIGGTYVFGIIGFFVGPLLLAYLVLLIEIYKNKNSEESIVIIEHEKS